MKTVTVMKRVILAIFCLSILTTHLSAQKKKELVNTPSAEEYISLYWFEKAEEVLAKERKALARKRKPTTRQDSLQEEIDRLRIATHSTERVVVIDSIRIVLFEQIVFGETAAAGVVEHPSGTASVFEEALFAQFEKFVPGHIVKGELDAAHAGGTAL